MRGRWLRPQDARRLGRAVLAARAAAAARLSHARAAHAAARAHARTHASTGAGAGGADGGGPGDVRAAARGMVPRGGRLGERLGSPGGAGASGLVAGPLAVALAAPKPPPRPPLGRPRQCRHGRGGLVRHRRALICSLHFGRLPRSESETAPTWFRWWRSDLVVRRFVFSETRHRRQDKISSLAPLRRQDKIRLLESPTTHPATGRGRGKAVKVYSAKGRRRHRTKVKPRRGVAEGKTPHTYLTLHNIQIGKTPVG